MVGKIVARVVGEPGGRPFADGVEASLAAAAPGSANQVHMAFTQDDQNAAVRHVDITVVPVVGADGVPRRYNVEAVSTMVHAQAAPTLRIVQVTETGLLPDDSTLSQQTIRVHEVAGDGGDAEDP